ncbi:hypothetical protein LTR10_004732 [Elasticomyces elasticus]|nr:hypothetical protein LTR10_004732 [Elasticomyces elasticus]KAK4977049.1 hypothetical protein LTR42_003095 [Elasticomyces elasticus]
MPTENSTPRYRDQSVTTVIKPPPGVNSLWLSPVLGTPELIVPIETIPYQSRVSQREELLPFAVGLMSAKDMDLALFDVTIKCLQEVGRSVKVKCGKVPF